MLVALAATISLGALLRPLLWTETPVASAADRAVQPIGQGQSNGKSQPNGKGQPIGEGTPPVREHARPIGQAALEAPSGADAAPAVERAAAAGGEAIEARVKRNVAPNRERPGQGHVPPRDA